MSKNIKRIIAIAMAVGTISALTPATNMNLLTTKAYASSEDADELDSIDLQNNDGSSLDLCTDSSCDDELDEDLDVGETYYAESTTSKVSIDSIDGADEDNVRIFKGSSDKAYEVGDNISLDDGTTTLKVRVYEDEYDDDEDYSSSDYNQYTLKVIYDEDDDDDDDDDDNDTDTLDELTLETSSGSDIKLYSDDDYDSDNEVDSDDVDEGETYYAKTSKTKVVVNTEGPDDDYVRIFKDTSSSTKGKEVGDDISLSSGTNTLTVRIYSSEPDDDVKYKDDDDVVGTYKIKVKCTASDDDSSSSSTTSSSSSTTTKTTSSTSTSDIATTEATATTSVSSTKTNQWVQANGKWQYYDATGNLVKSAWVGNYYLQADGNMATGWLSNNGKWYYLGTDGIKKTGWQSVGGTWYYLDSQGVMMTGWIKDMNGKYYYLNTNGSMAYSTTINGYKLGADGAWVK